MWSLFWVPSINWKHLKHFHLFQTENLEEAEPNLQEAESFDLNLEKHFGSYLVWHIWQCLVAAHINWRIHF